MYRVKLDTTRTRCYATRCSPKATVASVFDGRGKVVERFPYIGLSVLIVSVPIMKSNRDNGFTFDGHYLYLYRIHWLHNIVGRKKSPRVTR